VDNLTRDILIDSGANIQIYVEYRHPNIFLTYLMYKSRWYWGSGANWNLGINDLINVLYKNHVPNPNLIPVDPITHNLIDNDTGRIFKDSLNDQKQVLHNEIILINYSSKFNKKILACVKSKDGYPYVSEGKDIFEATNNIIKNINYLSNFNMGLI